MTLAPFLLLGNCVLATYITRIQPHVADGVQLGVLDTIQFGSVRFIITSDIPGVKGDTEEDKQVQVYTTASPETIDESQAYFIQTTPVWSLDRVSRRQTSPKQNGRYIYPVDKGYGVNVFIVDTGIDTTHPEFQGRSVWGINTADNRDTDCNGHGTHVAGTVGSVTYGVAKGVKMIAVKVLGCSGSGSYSGILKGLEYVYNNHDSITPAVVNLSLGGPKSRAINTAVAEMVRKGIHVVVAAGNENSDACQTSPASETSVITVGATDNRDTIATFSNWGACVDILAPGVRITSTIPNGKIGIKSGTSMASPAQAGVLALLLSKNPKLPPGVAKSLLSGSCTKNKVSGNLNGSPNCLAYTL